MSQVCLSRCHERTNDQPRRVLTGLSCSVLSNLENVVATAIGRYRIHERDWYATHAPDQRRDPGFPRVTEARTLQNSIVRPWSWPAVLVFVKTWEQKDRLGSQAVPRTLYLPDGRVVPTCVILATPDEELPPPVPGPSQVSSLLGGGYSCSRLHQGIRSLGTLGCLVQRWELLRTDQSARRGR
ncbi:MAG: hypothetical protein WDO69_26985 [Pseudomonadota bacterium]